MRCVSAMYLLLTALGPPVPAADQPQLTLTDVIARARAQNPDAGSSAAAEHDSSASARDASGMTDDVRVVAPGRRSQNRESASPTE